LPLYYLLICFYPKVDFNSTQLIITEPMLNFASIQEGIEEVMFEDFGFDALVRIHGLFRI